MLRNSGHGESLYLPPKEGADEIVSSKKVSTFGVAIEVFGSPSSHSKFSHCYYPFSFIIVLKTELCVTISLSPMSSLCGLFIPKYDNKDKKEEGLPHGAGPLCVESFLRILSG